MKTKTSVGPTERKKQIKREISALFAERAALCLQEKARKQSDEETYFRLVGPTLVVLRCRPGMLPTTQALNSGMTLISRHYKHTRNEFGYLETVSAEESIAGSLAFTDAINPETGRRWYATWGLWDWGFYGPTLHAEPCPKVRALYDRAIKKPERA